MTDTQTPPLDATDAPPPPDMAEGGDSGVAEALGGADILPPQLLGKLKQLTLISRKIFAGRMKGERRSTRRGQSVEFADFRNYVHGDDPRHIDWNTYGRLEKLYLKLFMEEEDLYVYILLDCSGSMESGPKWKFARALAGALAYISTLNQDHVAIGGFRAGLTDVMRPKRGKGQAPRVLDFLAGIKPGGRTALGQAVKRHLLENRRAGLAIVISDFLDPLGYEEGLKMLQSRKFDIFTIQVLAPDELRPALRGDLRLVDSETGETTEVSISGRLLDSYQRAVQGYCDGLKEFCRKRGMGYLLADAGGDLEDLILRYFRSSGLVK